MALLRHPLIVFLLSALPPGALAAQPCVVPLVERDGSGVAIRPLPLAEGEVAVRLLGADHATVTALLPASAGVSADVVRAAATGRLVIHCARGEVRVSVHGADGTPRDLPPVPVERYRSLALRVSVTAAAGPVGAFRVVDGAGRPDPGPVVDLFGGRVPLEPGDLSITLEARPAESGAPVSGRAPLRFAGDFVLVDVVVGDRMVGPFVVDLGASASAIAREHLPEGIEVREVVSESRSAEGVQTRRAGAGALGGESGGMAGRATLPSLRIGDAEVADLTLAVFDSMPKIHGVPIAGVLGLDVLRRAGVARLGWPAEGGAAPALWLGESVAAAPAAAGEMIEVPLEEAHGLLFARGALNDAPVRWLLDTGARATVVPPGLAEAAELVLADGAADTLRGMDGRPIAALLARPATLRVGEAGFPDQTVAVADLPVLGAMGLAAEAALLGQPFWRGFATVEVDFRAGVLRLGAARRVEDLDTLRRTSY